LYSKYLYLNYFSVDILKLLFNFLYTAVIKTRNRLGIFSNVFSQFEKFINITVQLILINVPNYMTENYSIAWSGESQFDNSINSMKVKAFQYLNSLVSNYKSKINDENLIKTYTDLISASIRNLEFVVTNKFKYIQEMSKDSISFPDYNYENLLHQIMIFLDKVLIREPFISQFNSLAKQYIFF
jgi:hypothetical protein